jgi:hypothetical protein
MTDAASGPLPDFRGAMALASTWIAQWEAEELSDEVLAERVGGLVRHLDGARGFFVVALSGEGPLMDRLPEVLVQQLRAAGEGVVDLSVRNLAMSTAMVVQHGAEGRPEQQLASRRIALRSTELLRLLEPLLVKQRLEQLLEGTRGQGEDQAFLERWGYDDTQIQAIAEAAQAVAE